MKFKKMFFVALMSMFAFSNIANAQQSAELKAGDESPKFSFPDVKGNMVSSDDFKGKYVFIDLWASWCPPCQAELPHLKALEKKMHGKNIVFVSISLDEDEKAWKDMVEKESLADYQLRTDVNDPFLIKYKVNSIPRFILVDKEGKIVIPNMTRPSQPETLKILETLEGI